MKDRRKADFGPYLRAIADLMGLRDWTVGIDTSIPQPEHVAEVDCRYGRKIAWVVLSEAFLDLKPSQQRDTICHELVHCHFAPMRQLAMGMLSQEQWDCVNVMFEYGVDAMAEALAPHMPLPDQVAAEEAEVHDQIRGLAMRLALTKTPFAAATADQLDKGTVELVEVDAEGKVTRTGEEIEVMSPLNRNVPIGRRVSIEEDSSAVDRAYLTEVFYT